jgi:FkbM family methyltransferase
MFHFQTRFYGALERIGWVRRQKVFATLLDQTYQIIAGSLRTEDYDDAWLLALGFHATVVMDVGCNVGQSALLLLYSHSVKEILLIDPNPSALATCAENLILNGLAPRARFVPAFASDVCDAEVDFFTVGAGAAGSKYGGQAHTACDLGRTLRVRTVTLDALCDRYALVPDLVKIDVEGAEGEVLRGARQLAARQKTHFIVELHSHPQLSMETNALELLKWCGECGYTAWYLKTKQPIKEANVLKDRGRCHVLLLPSMEDFPEYLQPLPQGASLQAVTQSIGRPHLAPIGCRTR